jgi:plastocyanin
MIWRSATCSNGFPIRGALGLVLAVLVARAASGGASVTGRIELRDSKESAVSKKMDYSGVVVWLDPTAGRTPPPATPARAAMAQKDKTFSPHVLAVRTGTLVDFPNFDPIFHNAFSNYDGKVFDVGLYPPGTSRTVAFSRPGVVRVFCNIHAAMSAVIVVVDTPYFTTTHKDGTFEIRNVPEGEYTLRLFHERALATILNRSARTIAVLNETVTLMPISLSESGYLAAPHKNKFGRDYSTEPEDTGYPAVHK